MKLSTLRSLALVGLAFSPLYAAAAPQTVDLGQTSVTLDNSYSQYQGYSLSAYPAGRTTFEQQTIIGTTLPGVAVAGAADYQPDNLKYFPAISTESLYKEDLVVSSSANAIRFSFDPDNSSIFDFTAHAGWSCQLGRCNGARLESELAFNLPLAFTANAGYQIVGYKVTLGTTYARSGTGSATINISGKVQVQGQSGLIDLISVDLTPSGNVNATSLTYSGNVGANADFSNFGGFFNARTNTPTDTTAPDLATLRVQYVEVQAVTAAVPEPGMASLLAAGLGLLRLRKRVSRR